ncbi:hypothetical protein [Rheinheimera sp.]|uniref:hypothetical protein n=1 Tax=Rheinheimera sp. TaxID=1869214 RepID=UPI0037C5EE92
MSKKIDIHAVKTKNGIPVDSTFLGYAIYRPDTKEYAAVAIENDMESRWGWAIEPQYARPYKNYSEVKRLVSEYFKQVPLVIGLLFKCGDHVMFGTE